MKTRHTDTDDHQESESVYEAHLFEYVLRHISKDSSLEPRINNAISMQLFSDELYAEYYGKVQQLYAQGLFNDSFSYADYLSAVADKSEETPGASLSPGETRIPREGRPMGRQVSLGVFLSAVASVVLAFAIVFIFIGNDGGGIKTLGNDANLYAYDLARLGEGKLEIKHNSVLLKEEGDMKQCNMLLVFKGTTEDGFLARSKNLKKGNEDPFLEDLEVRFPDSERSQEVINELKSQLNNRLFPEYFVQGIYIKPKQRLDTFNNLPVILINEILPASVIE